MDIKELAEWLYEDLNGQITLVHMEDSNLSIRLEADALLESKSRRVFELTFRHVIEVSLRPGSVASVGASKDHPLLLKYQSPYEELYFSSEPASVEEMISALYLAHLSVMQDWRPMSETINMGSNLPALLRAGRGLLARGPAPLIQAYVDAVGAYAELSRIAVYSPTHAEQPVFLFDTYGQGYVICEEVEVREITEMEDRKTEGLSTSW